MKDEKEKIAEVLQRCAKEIADIVGEKTFAKGGIVSDPSHTNAGRIKTTEFVAPFGAIKDMLIKDLQKQNEQLKQQIARMTMAMHEDSGPKNKNKDLWERMDDAAPGEWVTLNPESEKSGFVRWADKAEPPHTTMLEDYQSEQLDKYAIPAMQGMYSDKQFKGISYPDHAAHAYRMAQAMIEQRNKVINDNKAKQD